MKQPDFVLPFRWAVSGGIISDWTVAIDGGACYGDWSSAMVERFERVIAFEPASDMAAALRERFAGDSKVEVHNSALLDRVCKVNVRSPRKRQSKTARQVWPNGTETPAISIDSLELQTCGLIKLDLEGSELLALEGARKTMKRCSPVMIIEVNNLGKRLGVTQDDIMTFMSDRGYTLVHQIPPDCIFRK